MKKNWLKSRKITLCFATIALIGGFLFLRPNLTGSVILNSGTSFNFLSIIGFLLIFCSLILISYSVKHTKA